MISICALGAAAEAAVRAQPKEATRLEELRTLLLESIVKELGESCQFLGSYTERISMLQRSNLNTRAMRLLNLLQLEQVDDNLFRAENEPENGQRIFGGQVIAQALIASSRTLDGYRMHSCHAYFLRPGDNNKPVLLDVERVRDGRSFAMRRVVAIQNGQAIFNMDISFHTDEPGFEHSEPMHDMHGSARDHEGAFVDSSRANLCVCRPVAGLLF